MITGDCAFGWRPERKANRKACWNAPRARHRDEQRMEVGAVPPFDVACIDGVAASPSLPALVVVHVRDYVVVDGPGLLVRRSVRIAYLCADQLYLSVDRTQAVRAEIGGKRRAGGLRNIRLGLFQIRRFLDAPHMETDR